ncbi:hypothetical protein F5B20DRAFT_506903 [Whalleya microplaca]|nr:hypothetical protein F5B20DRAFT_506903 [Whalleya microplaca]
MRTDGLHSRHRRARLPAPLFFLFTFLHGILQVGKKIYSGYPAKGVGKGKKKKKRKKKAKNVYCLLYHSLVYTLVCLSVCLI